MNPTQYTYQPEQCTIRKDTLYAAIPAIENGLEYARECLATHEEALGRTTRKNQLTAEAMERDIVQMQTALDGLIRVRRDYEEVFVVKGAT